MYIIKEDKREELKDGRTYASMANILGVTQRFLSLIFNGSKCKKMLAMTLINIKNKTAINSPEMQEQLKYYFDEE